MTVHVNNATLYKYCLSLQSVWLHVLGEEAMESQEKDSLAAGYVSWGSAGHWIGRWDRCTCNDHWHSCLGWKKGQFQYVVMMSQYMSLIVPF